MSNANAVVAANVRRCLARKSMTQAHFGDLSGHNRKWAQRVLASEAKITVEEVERMADILKVAPAVLTGWMPESKEVPDMDRRSFLKAGVAVGAGLALAPADTLARLGGATPALADLELITAQGGSWHWVMGPQALLPILDSHRQTMERLLAQGRDSKALMGQLAETRRLMGINLYRLEDTAGARREFTAAEALAAEAGDGVGRARALTAHRDLVSPADTHRGLCQDGSSQALDMLAAAERSAGPAAPAGVRVMIHACRAEEFGAAGRESEARFELERASRALAQMPRRPELGYYDHWTATRLNGWAGSVLLHLGLHREAADVLEPVVADTAPTPQAYRAATLSNLGAAYALMGQPERCVALQLDSLEAARVHGLQYEGGRIRTVRERYLAPYADLPAVRQLDEALAA